MLKSVKNCLLNLQKLFLSQNGELATFLSFLSIGLMIAGTLVGKIATQKTTRTYSQAQQTQIGECNDSDAWVCEIGNWKNCAGRDVRTLFNNTYCNGELMWKYQAALNHGAQGNACGGIAQPLKSSGCGGISTTSPPSPSNASSVTMKITGKIIAENVSLDFQKISLELRMYDQSNTQLTYNNVYGRITNADANGNYTLEVNGNSPNDFPDGNYSGGCKIFATWNDQTITSSDAFACKANQTYNNINIRINSQHGNAPFISITPTPAGNTSPSRNTNPCAFDITYVGPPASTDPHNRENYCKVKTTGAAQIIGGGVGCAIADKGVGNYQYCRHLANNDDVTEVYFDCGTSTKDKQFKAFKFGSCQSVEPNPYFYNPPLKENPTPTGSPKISNACTAGNNECRPASSGGKAKGSQYCCDYCGANYNGEWAWSCKVDDKGNPIKCNNNTGYVVFPLRCENNQWILKNPAGECKNNVICADSPVSTPGTANPTSSAPSSCRLSSPNPPLNSDCVNCLQKLKVFNQIKNFYINRGITNCSDNQIINDWCLGEGRNITTLPACINEAQKSCNFSCPSDLFNNQSTQYLVIDNAEIESQENITGASVSIEPQNSNISLKLETFPFILPTPQVINKLSNTYFRYVLSPPAITPMIYKFTQPITGDLNNFPALVVIPTTSAKVKKFPHNFTLCSLPQNITSSTATGTNGVISQCTTQNKINKITISLSNTPLPSPTPSPSPPPCESNEKVSIAFEVKLNSPANNYFIQFKDAKFEKLEPTPTRTETLLSDLTPPYIEKSVSYNIDRIQISKKSCHKRKYQLTIEVDPYQKDPTPNGINHTHLSSPTCQKATLDLTIPENQELNFSRIFLGKITYNLTNDTPNTPPNTCSASSQAEVVTMGDSNVAFAYIVENYRKIGGAKAVIAFLRQITRTPSTQVLLCHCQDVSCRSCKPQVEYPQGNI